MQPVRYRGFFAARQSRRPIVTGSGLAPLLIVIMTYSEQLKHPNWQKKRLEVLNRDEWTCRICGDTETRLHVHHRSYIKGRKAWDYPNENFTTLCEPCHELVTGVNRRLCAATDFEPSQYALIQALDFMERSETFSDFVNLMGLMSRDHDFARSVFEMSNKKIEDNRQKEK